MGERLTREQLRRHRLVPVGGDPADPSFADVYLGVKPAATARRPPS
jgi:hypothetical protein